MRPRVLPVPRVVVFFAAPDFAVVLFVAVVFFAGVALRVVPAVVDVRRDAVFPRSTRTPASDPELLFTETRSRGRASVVAAGAEEVEAA